MQYAMVSILIPKEYETTFNRIGRKTMQDAANALQWNIYHGLCEQLGQKMPIFNLLPCGSYPQYCKKMFIPRFDFDENGKNLGFCNVKVIHNYFRTTALKKALEKWCNADEGPKTLFLYTLSHSLLAAVSYIKNRYANVRVCAIVADLPDMSNLSSNKSLALKLFSARKAKESYSLLSAVDCFVLLTKHMADYMNLQKPFCVMEGIATEQSNFSEPQYDSDKKTIFYAGTLHKKFGVLNLIEAFSLIDDSNYRLVICGTGDSEEEIIEAAKKDARIEFYGQLSRAEVLKLQTKATVLVNPRQNNEEFTKYSFPSKNLEYLSSGIPVIAYKLDGIPDEYDNYIVYVEDDDALSLSKKIIEICEKSSSARKITGEIARKFVSEQKNNFVQTKKIIDLLGQGGEING